MFGEVSTCILSNQFFFPTDVAVLFIPRVLVGSVGHQPLPCVTQRPSTEPLISLDWLPVKEARNCWYEMTGLPFEHLMRVQYQSSTVESDIDP